MTTYAYDSYGAPVEIVEDEVAIVGRDWKGQDIHEDEQILVNKAWRPEKGSLSYREEHLFEDDIYDYIKTLTRDDLLEIVEKVDVDVIIAAADMEETYL